MNLINQNPVCNVLKTPNFKIKLRELRTKIINKIIIAQININSIRNKFDLLFEGISNNIDILLITETKIDDSFPIAQFKAHGYSLPYRLDRDSKGGGIMLYIREDIPSKKIVSSKSSIENFFIAINLRTTKWLVSCSYNPHSSFISDHLKELSKCLDRYCTKYDNILLIGDFNCDVNDSKIKHFCDEYNLTNLINKPTCYKNPDNPSCIDLMLTNFPKQFQDSCLLETDLSDFHKMTVTILKAKFIKLKPRITLYRNYSKFNNFSFRKDLCSAWSVLHSKKDPFSFFQKNTTNIFDIHAPQKRKYVRGNQMPFITKALRKAIMLRSHYRNIYLKEKTEINKQRYNKQRNFCVSQVRRAKQDYFQNINENHISDNKKFWKTVKPYFSNKHSSNERITLLNNGKIISKDDELAHAFNDFFANIVKKLNLPDPPASTTNIKNPIYKSIAMFEHHPSIKAIKQNMKTLPSFSFRDVTNTEVERVIKSLNSGKACQENDIPIKIIKLNKDIFSDVISYLFNLSLKQCTFPDPLKLAHVTPIFKKGDKNVINNYRPVSILPNISKVFEKLLYNQMSEYFENILSKFQCGFRKNISTQHCLMLLVEKWKRALDDRESFCTLLTDLSKAFDCICHDLLIAKLNAYNFDLKSLKYMLNYLSNRKQRTKINDKYSTWTDCNIGVPQGSILGPLLFNIYMCDLFMILSEYDFANYADDTTPFAKGKTFHDVKIKIEEISHKLFCWFKINQLKGNADKCHFLLNNPDKSKRLRIENTDITNSLNEKLLGVHFDNLLKFDIHVDNLCKKASNKLHALSRIATYMSQSKRKTIMNAFISSQFNYCPLIWMFHSRGRNSKINRIHERCLRIIYNDKSSTFKDLLEKDGSVTIHHRNLQYLAIELYKIVNKLSPNIINELFQMNHENSNNLRNLSKFRSRKIKTTLYGSESLSYLGPKIWELVPLDVRNSNTLQKFKNKIRSWIPSECPCRLCKVYIKHIGIIDTNIQCSVLR